MLTKKRMSVCEEEKSQARKIRGNANNKQRERGVERRCTAGRRCGRRILAVVEIFDHLLVFLLFLVLVSFLRWETMQPSQGMRGGEGAEAL